MTDTQHERRELIAALQKVMPAELILHSDQELAPYECDGLSVYRARPLLVVLPEDTGQLAAVLRHCHAQRIPVVVRGAGTGLSGGALPLENGVLIGLAKFNRIISIDTKNRTATVQPGVRNLAISEAASRHGLYYAPDPSSQIACSIGGNVAENAGGVHCLKYGLTVHNIVQLEMLGMDGEPLTIGAHAPDAPGFDLLALMTGSEGLLGVITEVTVKLLTRPEKAKVILAAFDDIAAAGRAVSAVIASGVIPAGLEMMDNGSIRAADDFVRAGYPREAAAILLCEIDGDVHQVEDELTKTQQVLLEAGATELRVARDEAERLRFWAGRKAAFPAAGRLSPDYYCMDGTIPRRHIAEVLTRIEQLSQEYGLRVINVFHAGDGNLHPLILYDSSHAGELEKAEEFGGRILEICVEFGGTITGEHGVGVEKIKQMCIQFNAAELTQFHAVKAAFDPRTLLNPGKAVPELHRCAELGGMHVHGGRLPHPELERF